MTPCNTSADPLGVADPWLKTTVLDDPEGSTEELTDPRQLRDCPTKTVQKLSSRPCRNISMCLRTNKKGRLLLRRRWTPRRRWKHRRLVDLSGSLLLHEGTQTSWRDILHFKPENDACGTIKQKIRTLLGDEAVKLPSVGENRNKRELTPCLHRRGRRSQCDPGRRCSTLSGRSRAQTAGSLPS